MTRIAVICARGGSKGVLGKNIRLLCGKPLIAWTIAQAFESELFDAVAVSSDSPEIRDTARAAGADFVVDRPPEMATDTVSVHPAIRHCLDAVERQIGGPADSFVLLQTTSPLRKASDICAASDLFEAHRPGSVITGSWARNSPYYSLVEETASGSVVLSKPTDPPLARRQDAPHCYDMNGAIYVFDRDRYISDPRVLYPDTRLWEMPEERSLDIDTELDWAIAELLFPRVHHVTL